MQTDTTRENPQGSVPQASDSNLDLSATAPGQLRVIKRNGTVVPYTDDKITVAITKAFLAVEGGTAAASSRIHDTVARLTEQVTATFKRRMPSGGHHPHRGNPGPGRTGPDACRRAESCPRLRDLP